MRLPNPNRLLVEGEEDKRVIPQLIEKNGIPWGNRQSEWIVEIAACGGIDKMLEPGSISTELKARNLKRLGILVDADQAIDGCWQRIRNACITHFPTLPEMPLPEGTVVQNEDGQSLGIWLMPDNRSHGMLETFLAHLVPDEHEALWAHAESATSEAMQIGAPFPDPDPDARGDPLPQPVIIAPTAGESG